MFVSRTHIDSMEVGWMQWNVMKMMYDGVDESLCNQTHSREFNFMLSLGVKLYKELNAMNNNHMSDFCTKWTDK